MTKKIFNSATFRATGANKLNEMVMRAAASTPEIRKEIRRVFQVANRRLQNIERSGLYSPAAEKIRVETNVPTDGFAVFTMRQTWEDLKTDYARAIAFLQQPTSTATGTRQYNTHLAQQFGVTPEQMNILSKGLADKLGSLGDSQWVQNILSSYSDFTNALQSETGDVSGKIENDARAIDARLQQALNAIADDSLSQDLQHLEREGIQKILDTLDDFGV